MKIVNGTDSDQGDDEIPKRQLSGAAKRALAEAEARRRKADTEHSQTRPEINGCSGPDPVRYGDWEKGGLVSDF